MVLPLCVMTAMAMNHRVPKNAPDGTPFPETFPQKAALLDRNMNVWPALSWREKEAVVFMTMTYFRREKNTAILKSPEHYVLLINQLLKKDPAARQASLGTILQRLAVLENDLWDGKTNRTAQ